MLKINLLPAYVRQKAALKKAIGLCTAAVVIVGAVMGYWIYSLNEEKKQLNEDTIKMETEMRLVEKLRAQVKAEQAKIPPIQNKINFFEGIKNYNLQLPALYEEVSRYTYNRVELSSMSASGNRVTMQAHARTLGDFGRYLLNMYHATNLYSNVSVSSIPGWPSPLLGTTGPTAQMPADANFTGILPEVTGGIDFSVNCTLVKPIAGAPSY